MYIYCGYGASMGNLRGLIIKYLQLLVPLVCIFVTSIFWEVPFIKKAEILFGEHYRVT